MKRGDAYLRSEEKQMVDAGMAMTIALMLGPAALYGAHCIRAEEGSPALYRHPRYGQGWASFDMLKLRTMIEGNAPLHKDDRLDKRITHTGRWLRRYNLDEVPQILHVLKGEMHVVAPRAVDEKERERLADTDPVLYDEWEDAYGRYRPGIVGGGNMAQRKLLRQGKPAEAYRVRMQGDLRFWDGDNMGRDVREFFAVPGEFLAHWRYCRPPVFSDIVSTATAAAPLLSTVPVSKIEEPER
ncbi:MAG TPA: sugar transferase [Candidatus Saccharimonadales bacterium]|nr:sugar transferase [Candidatus Saccharimonadales bacterium]